MVQISYIFLCLSREQAGLDTHTVENLNLRFEVLICLLFEFPCDLHFANISNVMCKDDACKQSYEPSWMLMHAHVPAIPLILCLGIISVQAC